MIINKKSLPAGRQGMTLVEVIVAATIITIFLTALVNVHNAYLNIILSGTRSTKATFLSEEGVEAVKFLRNASWTTNIATLTNGTNYRLTWQGGLWLATTSSSMIDSLYDRTFVLSAVGRSAQSDIVTSGGTNDPNTRKLTVTVAWKEKGATTTSAVSTYLTNLYAN